jgi:hypothetical protein
MIGSWSDVPADVRALVEATLAPWPLQLEAWRLRECGASWRTIALVQGVGKTTVRDRVAAADLRLRKAGLRQNAHGRYSIGASA